MYPPFAILEPWATHGPPDGWDTHALAEDLASGACHLWFLPASSLPHTFDFLSADEEASIASYIRPLDALQAATSYALRRWLLSLYLPGEPGTWVFQTHQRGKPILATPSAFPLHFNLSHTAGGIAFAAFQRPLGIDLEALSSRRSLDRIAEIALSPSEAAIWETLSSDQRTLFLLLRWTLKEAYIKSLGLGFAIPLHTLTLLPPPAPYKLLDPARSTEACLFASLACRGHLLLSLVLPDTLHPPPLRYFVLQRRPLKPPFALSEVWTLPTSVFSGDL